MSLVAPFLTGIMRQQVSYTLSRARQLRRSFAQQDLAMAFVVSCLCLFLFFVAPALLSSGPLEPVANCGGLSMPGPFTPGEWPNGNTPLILAPSDTDPNRTVPANVMFPQDTPKDSAGYRMPVVVFVHGLAQPDFEYDSYFSHFASWGFLVIGVAADYSLTPSYKRFALDLRAALNWAEASNDDKTSVLYGRVDTQQSATFGHSLGAYLCVYAAAYPNIDRRIKAIVSLAGGIEPGIKSDFIHEMKIPFMVVSGSADILVPSSISEQMFDIAQPPKFFSEIQGAWHCGWMDRWWVGPGAICRPLTGWMEKFQQMQLTRCLYTPFLLQYLKGNASAAQQLWNADEHPLMRVRAESGLKLEPKRQEISANISKTLATPIIEARLSVTAGQPSSIFISKATLPARIAVTSESSASVFVEVPRLPFGSSQHSVVVSASSPDLTLVNAQIIITVVR